jgi:hypothetical protein
MQIKLNKREVELFYAGLLLGKTLDVDQEWSTHDCVGFGDFEGLLIRLCKKTLTLDFDHTDGREKYFASIGIMYEAQKEVEEWLGGDK